MASNLLITQDVCTDLSHLEGQGFVGERSVRLELSGAKSEVCCFAVLQEHISYADLVVEKCLDMSGHVSHKYNTSACKLWRYEYV